MAQPGGWKSILVAALGLSLALALGALAAGQDEFLPAVGVWRSQSEAGQTVLKVDGSAWKRGQAAAELKKSAAAAFGDKGDAFAGKVASAANFPFAIHAGTADFRQGSLSVRFKPLAGKSDQAGGILFDLKENGDYLVVRANALESNLILFQYKNGKRSALKEMGNAPAATGSWSDLRVAVKGRDVKGYLNNALILEHTLDQPVSGRVGLWSKDDSVALFQGFAVQAAD